MKFIAVFIAVAAICAVFVDAETVLCPCCCPTATTTCPPPPPNCIGGCKIVCIPPTTAAPETLCPNGCPDPPTPICCPGFVGP